MASSKSIPWSEIGSEGARQLIAQSDQLSRSFTNALEGVPTAKLPDFKSRTWRYEFCIFIMFWFWYVAHSPKFTRAGATKPMLDAYHKGCYKALVDAGLLDGSKDALEKWEEDIEARFLAYKDAYDAHLTGIHEDAQLESLKIYSGTVGWLLAHHLFPGQQPNFPLVILLNELGSVHFTGLVEMFNNLGRHYARNKPWWKFWTSSRPEAAKGEKSGDEV